MQSSTIGIVGYGHFGQFIAELANRFLPEISVRVYSRRHPPDQKTFFDLATTASSSYVVLCGGIAEYEEQLQSLLPYLSPNTVVVDVATVKQHTTSLLQRLLPEQSWIATHPMFGPESYNKTDGNVSGYRVAVTGHTLLSEQYVAVTTWLSSLGVSVIEMTPEEHDTLLADTLFMTHYIGQVMQTAGFVRTDIDTVSFGYLMNAVESVGHDSKLFQDVYHFNPYCEAAAVRFHEAQEVVLRGLQKRRDE
jgi:prephenate dehydrogenase